MPPNSLCSLPLTPRLPPAAQPSTHTYTGRGTRTLLQRWEVTELEGGLVNFPCLLAPPTPAQNKCVCGGALPGAQATWPVLAACSPTSDLHLPRVWVRMVLWAPVIPLLGDLEALWVSVSYLGKETTSSVFPPVAFILFDY